MSRIMWVVSVLMVTCAVSPLGGFAAEHGGKEHGGSSTTAPAATTDTTAAPVAPEVKPESVAPAVPAAPAVATPAAPPALKPIVITFSGDVASMDAKTRTPAVQDPYGTSPPASEPPSRLSSGKRPSKHRLLLQCLLQLPL